MSVNGAEATPGIEEHPVGLAPQKWCSISCVGRREDIAEAAGDRGFERLHHFRAGPAHGVQPCGAVDLTIR